MFPILSIGPLAIQTPGLVLIIGVYISVLVVEKQSIRHGLKASDGSNIIFIYLLSTILIGRLSYVFQFPSIFLENPLSLFSLSPSFFDFNSGLILSVLVVLAYIQKKRLSLLRVLDALTLPLLIFLIFFFFSLLASGDLYGKPSSLPWAIYLWGTTRHPLQIYYIIALIPVIAINILYSRQETRPGFLFFQTGISLSILVIFLDYFNGNPNNMISKFNILQSIAWISLIILISIKARMNNLYAKSLHTAPAD